MTYETPEVTVLNSAIGAIQATPPQKIGGPLEGSGPAHEVVAAYEDFE